jgi:hypothetical protein
MMSTNKAEKVTGVGNVRREYRVYVSPTSMEVVAAFKTKRELLAYGEKEQINADQVALFSARYPDGFIFLGWDEIEES